MSNPDNDSSRYKNRLNHISHGLIAMSLAFEIVSISYVLDVNTLTSEGKTVWIAGVPEAEMKYKLFLANAEREKEIEKNQQQAMVFMILAWFAGLSAIYADGDPGSGNTQGLLE